MNADIVSMESPVRVTAHRRSVRRLGHWTEGRRFEVRASGGSVVLDLRSPRLEAGEIEIGVDADHSMLKLLLPEDAVLDHDAVRRIGRCGFVDWGGADADPRGRVIRLTGEMRASELRVNRGGVAIVSAMLTPQYLADLRRAFRENRIGSLDDVRRAYREGRWTTVEQPRRVVEASR